jgi:hypothetical protein
VAGVKTGSWSQDGWLESRRMAGVKTGGWSQDGWLESRRVAGVKTGGWSQDGWLESRRVAANPACQLLDQKNYENRMEENQSRMGGDRPKGHQSSDG